MDHQRHIKVNKIQEQTAFESKTDFTRLTNFMVLKTNLQNYNKILKVSIKMAKKYYYHSCLHNVKGNIKKSWSTINDILCKKGKKNNFPDFFKIDDNIINNNTSIANKFNDFFSQP